MPTAACRQGFPRKSHPEGNAEEALVVEDPWVEYKSLVVDDVQQGVELSR